MIFGLQILAESVIARRAPIESALNWKNAALKEHTQRPFHAILAEADETKNSAVITIDVLDNVRDGRWYLPTIKPSLKTAVDIARAVRPLVARARQIVIIDPYFRAKEKHQNAAANRWVEPLVAILDAALDKREPELGFPKVVDRKSTRLNSSH